MPPDPSQQSTLQYSEALASDGGGDGVVPGAMPPSVSYVPASLLWSGEVRLQTLLAVLPAIVIILDGEGVYRLLGGRQLSSSPTQRVGNSVFDVHQDRPDILADVRRALAGEEVRATREARGGVWETHYSPLRDEAGTVTGVIYIAHDVTARARAEEALRERETRLRTQYQALPLPTYTWQWVEGDFIFVDYNAAADTFARGTLAPKLGQPASVIYRNMPEVAEHLARCFAERRAVQHEIRFESQLIDRVFDLIVTAVFVAPDLVVMHSEDVTERNRAEAALRASEASLAEAQRIAHLSSWEYDFVRSELRWSDESFRIVGYPPQSFVPTPERGMAFTHPDDREQVQRAFDAIVARDEPFDLDTRLVRPDGEVRMVRQQAELVRDATGRPIKLVGIGHDVTEQRALEARLAHQAFHDRLTGLPNRALFLDRLGQATARARREDRNCAVLFLDLDRFKDVNDTLGHAAGDRLLVTVAARLRIALRDDDTLARLGGDEFAVLLEGVADIDEATQVARRLLRALEPTVPLDGQAHRATASIGIVLGGAVDTNPEELLRDADVAMYRAKAAGRAGYAVYDPAMQAQLVARLALEQDLHQALVQEEFVLYYQPIVDLRTGRVVKAEALIRWQHPERGMVSPVIFIPLAEETGLIRPLGRWVLAEACRQARHWQVLFPGESPLTVSVNLSAREFLDPDLATEVGRVLRETGLPPQCLELEITEGVLMEDAPVTLTALEGLKRLGVQLAVDDFGTGYSSLAYLKRFPVDTLKIDRSFVSGEVADPDDSAIVTAIITMAHTLGLRVTAEGVETEAQAGRFALLGCALAQGYHFARPLSASDLVKLLRQSAALGTSTLANTPHRAPTTGELLLRRTARAKRLLLPSSANGPD